MYTKILVPLDGSKLAEQVLPYVRLLAKVYGAQVELLRIIDPDARPPFWPPEPTIDYLKQTAERCLPSVTQIECVEKTGKPADVIVDVAKETPACLIAMSTHGLTGVRRWVLGSVASKVVQIAANPLLLIHPPIEEGDPVAPITLKTIFVPLDGSGLALKVLPHVGALAKGLKLEVHLLRVFTLPPDAYVVADGVIAQGAARYREEFQREADEYLDGKVQELRAEGLERVIATSIEGDPASEIIDIACKTDFNLIAMSTHGRSGVGRWVLGSVAEKVVQHSRDPVLLIRTT
jgi:nucleotide-binding universal stress UspA family protein